MRILFLQHPGGNSRDIFFDIIEGYRQAGHETFVFELGPLWSQTEGQTLPQVRQACVKLYGETLLAFAWQNRIDLCASLWANGIMSLGDWEGRSFFEHARLPILMHWLDAPHWAHSGRVMELPSAYFNGPHCFHVVNNPATAAELQGVLGFANVLAVHNAASPTSFQPRPALEKDDAAEKGYAVEKEFDIVFGVGDDRSQPTDVMLDELRKDEPDVQAVRASAAAALRPQLLDVAAEAMQKSEDAERFVDEMIRVRLACRDEPMLDQIARLATQLPAMAPAVLTLLQNAKAFTRFSMTLREMENWERAFVFACFARDFRCASFGLSEPFKAWPGDRTHLGELAYKEQATAYGRARFGLNVMRWQDDVGLNLKPFEITLSGACLLQSYRAGIEDLFDESEAVVFRTPQEGRRKVAELLADPARIERMAVAGRERSLKAHCWKHRAAEIIGWLNADAVAKSDADKKAAPAAAPSSGTP